MLSCTQHPSYSTGAPWCPSQHADGLVWGSVHGLGVQDCLQILPTSWAVGAKEKPDAMQSSSPTGK